jgi:RNA polymerase sigma-70 factor (ECF subfamily)
MTAPAVPNEKQGRMRSLVDDNVHFVARTLRKGGVPHADLDDEVQRTFIIAARRIEDVRLGAERSFLFQVARNTASHARRTLARRREFPSDDLPERSEPLGTPEDLAVRKQMRALLEAALGSIDESLQAVFVLYELEGMDSLEIAATLGIPRGTVASRLRRARTQLRRSLAAVEVAWDLGVASEADVEGPAPLRRVSPSRLERALLGAGASRRASAAIHARTLAACLTLAAG